VGTAERTPRLSDNARTQAAGFIPAETIRILLRDTSRGLIFDNSSARPISQQSVAHQLAQSTHKPSTDFRRKMPGAPRCDLIAEQYSQCAGRLLIADD
jgi:hypothetical protein